MTPSDRTYSTPLHRFGRALTLWLPPLLIVAGLILSLWAWVLQGLRLDDAAYKAMGALNLLPPYQDLAGKDMPWQLHAGRWITAIGVFWTAVVTVWRVLADDVARARAHIGRWETVVIGADGLAREASRALRAEQHRHLWLGASELVGGLRHIALLFGPAGSLQDTLHQHTDAARHVLISGLSAPDTIAAAWAVRAASPDARLTLVTDAPLPRHPAGLIPDDTNTHIACVPGLLAASFHRACPAFMDPQAREQGRVRLVLVGFGETGQALARDVIINGRTTWLDLPEIMIVDPQAGSRLAAWRQAAPELDLTAHITAATGMVCPEHPLPCPIEAIASATRIVVSVGDDGATLACLEVLLGCLPALNVPPIFARIRSDGLRAALAGGGQVTPFGGAAALLEELGFLGPGEDTAARAYHAAWLQAQAANPAAMANNPAARPWDELPPTYRAASRAAAAHIPAKLASAGIDPSLWLGLKGLPVLPAATSLYGDQAELMALAALEHERWNAERRLDGWAHADLAHKDEARKLHPSLMPFDALSPEVQAYDVAFVRLTGEMLRGEGITNAAPAAD